MVLRVAARLWALLGNDLRWRIQRATQATFLVGVSGVVLRDDGAVLLLRHRFWRLPAWALPGGYLQPRESFEDALRREVREETGLEIAPERLVRLAGGFRYRIEATFVCRVTGGTLRADGREVSAAAFFPLAALPTDLHPQHRGWIARATAPDGPGRERPGHGPRWFRP